jgi:hypothetical protein
MQDGARGGDNRGGGLFVGIELDKGEAAVGLQAELGDRAVGDKERDEVALGRIRHEVADVDAVREVSCARGTNVGRTARTCSLWRQIG